MILGYHSIVGNLQWRNWHLSPWNFQIPVASQHLWCRGNMWNEEEDTVSWPQRSSLEISLVRTAVPVNSQMENPWKSIDPPAAGGGLFTYGPYGAYRFGVFCCWSYFPWASRLDIPSVPHPSFAMWASMAGRFIWLLLPLAPLPWGSSFLSQF